MAAKTAQQIREKYQRRMQSAGPDYESGIKSPSRPWEESTIKGEDRYNVGVSEAIAEKRFSRGVRGKGEKWQRKSLAVGVQHYTQAAAVAAEEYGAVADKIISITQSVAAQVHAMDNSTEAAREARMIANARGIKAAWKK